MSETKTGQKINPDDIIKANKVAVVKSEKTGRVYLDADLCCHVFFNEEMANAYALKEQNCSVEPPRNYYPEDLKANFFRSGAKSFEIHGNRDTMRFDIYEKYIKTGQYNQRLAGVLNRYLETGDGLILKELTRCKFIVPARITNRVHISYGACHINKSEEYYYMAFTDLEAFRKWKPENKEWYPLQLDFVALFNIMRDQDLVINVHEHPVIIPSAVLTAYLKKE